MSGSTSGPLPSKHIFLHEVRKQPAGSKVRFLGCVTNYEVISGSLVLEHAFPHDTSPIPQVRVDVNLILQTVKSHELHPGTWLNVIGNVNRSAIRKNRPETSRGTVGQRELSSVQALVLWDAGAIRLEDYERILMLQQEMAEELQKR